MANSRRGAHGCDLRIHRGRSTTAAAGIRRSATSARLSSNGEISGDWPPNLGVHQIGASSLRGPIEPVGGPLRDHPERPRTGVVCARRRLLVGRALSQSLGAGVGADAARTRSRGSERYRRVSATRFPGGLGGLGTGAGGQGGSNCYRTEAAVISIADASRVGIGEASTDPRRARDHAESVVRALSVSALSRR